MINLLLGLFESYFSAVGIDTFRIKPRADVGRHVLNNDAPYRQFLKT